MARRIFVTGTDTGVGKTVTCAWLVHWLKADYWKPVQSGAESGEIDGQTVARLSRLTQPCSADAVSPRIFPSTYELAAPLSPHESARLERRSIQLEAFHVPPTGNALVVEGAGGVLVPLNEKHLMIDLIASLGMPVVVVARASLGTINHTLLTLEALRRRAIAILGVVICGHKNEANRAAIEHYGKTPIVGELPVLANLDCEALRSLDPPQGL